MLVRRCPPLLPHDRGYYAFRHFIAVRPKGLFLDCGANDGISALGFRKFDTSYEILSIEPNDQHLRELQKIAKRDPAFRYMIAGCGDRPGRVSFHVPVYWGVVLHTFTASDRDSVRETVRRYYGDRIANAVRIHSVEADVICIDDLDVAPSASAPRGRPVAPASVWWSLLAAELAVLPAFDAEAFKRAVLPAFDSMLVPLLSRRSRFPG